MAKRRKYNNTAGRLLEIFDAAVEYRQPNHPTFMAWQTALKLEVTPTSGLTDEIYVKLLKRMLPLQVALTEIEEDIKEQRPNEEHLCLRYFPALWSTVIPRNLEAPWSQVGANFGTAQLYSLELCANSLPEDSEIKQEELAEIFKAVDELFTQVRKSQINSHLKKWLLELLGKIKHSIDQYWVLGPKAFKAALITMVGEIALHRRTAETIKDEDKGLFDSIGGVFVKLVDLASKVNGAAHLLEYMGPIADGLPKLLGMQ